MIAVESTKDVEALGYSHVRMLPNGQWIGVMKMIYTWGLFVGIDRITYERRYCYEHCSGAIEAARKWNGAGDPLGPWIKEKPSDRLGPGAIG